ncbi:Nif11-like leader peptide family natural product precursor [Cyanobacterium sp. Dongsha4]|uniref:Nif11-like leader peptide family natural product precursor n=1 Tax=Cyanobacterium sp. DS4 TaxID=2878255 RepID=UPI002E82067E|nr:Nif11-like leader peptide family natural product precursor [Cyanobacterium sp. Dongsha4]WVL01351.1 Nif11-like leader peptide family natural product precursor [Cyanobacterium sp. Dongsha4]
MSKEAVEQFFARISEDNDLQQKLVSILQADIDHRQETAKLAQEYGFDITAEELSEEVKKRQEEFAQQQESEELSEEELESVAGGSIPSITVGILQPLSIASSIPSSINIPGSISNPFPKPKW